MSSEKSPNNIFVKIKTTFGIYVAFITMAMTFGETVLKDTSYTLDRPTFVLYVTLLYVLLCVVFFYFRSKKPSSKTVPPTVPKDDKQWDFSRNHVSDKVKEAKRQTGESDGWAIDANNVSKVVRNAAKNK